MGEQQASGKESNGGEASAFFQIPAAWSDTDSNNTNTETMWRGKIEVGILHTGAGLCVS